MKRKRANTLVALSSAAVMTVYAAGFMRTRAAAERLEHASRERPPALPVPAPLMAAASPAAEAQPSTSVVPPPPDTPKKVRAPKKAKRVESTVTSTPATEPAQVAAAAAPVELAPQPVAPEPPPPPPELPSAEMLLGGTALHDGTFLGWGSSRHGDIQASVTILSGRITAVSIAQCRTRYSCDVVAHLPNKVLKDQTPEKINNVSGATQSVDAFYYAVVDALNKAK
ncbi:MAG: FMN-binding protein [Acidobacteria bacterium]|nr:MAG: FMN-binding protein [Acidobacteriota bacterium]